MARDRLIAAALPIMAVLIPAAIIAATVLAASGSGTLGYDFRAYWLAVRHLLDGGSLYDPNVDYFGPSGAFFYPPTFAVLVVPFALLDLALATWIWTGVLVATVALAAAILPVARRTRWLFLLLAGISWPLVYAIKLGQVGPILLLVFALGWRWMDRPWRLGTAIAVGTAIKLQPGLLFVWALVTRRRRAFVAGLVVMGAAALVATLLSGPSSWVDLVTLLTHVSRPVDTPHNMTPSRIALEAGLSEGAAWAVQLANWALVAAVVLLALVRCTPAASYMAVVVATQLVSPILWDHYALVLLLPIAWLLDRGRRWPVLIPLATSVFFIGAVPSVTYPLAYWVTLVAVVREGWRTRT